MLCRSLVLALASAGVSYGALGLDGAWTVGQKFQIILSQVVDIKGTTPVIPTDAQVFDVDLFDTDASIIAQLQAQKKLVVCYFSAGTFEPNRPDIGNFTDADKGAALPLWPDEKWLNTNSTTVRKVMAGRIQLAKQKGCDGIDPDNMDPFDNSEGGGGGGFKPPLTSQDAIDYTKYLAGLAKAQNMAIGLKNAVKIIDSVSSEIQFAVNEQCSVNNECGTYNKFIASGKPVYHIEYPNAGNKLPANTTEKNTMCTITGTSGMSTVLKYMNLDGVVEYCDGSMATTITKDPPTGTIPGRPSTVKSTRTTSRQTATPTTFRTTRTSAAPTTRRTTTTSAAPTTRRTTTSSAAPTTRRTTTSSTAPTTSRTTSSAAAPTTNPTTTSPTTTGTDVPTTSDTSISSAAPTTSPTSISSAASTTSRTSITTPPTTVRTSTSRTSSVRPTTSAGGCTQKHWDQCGGQEWKGCTVCASGFTCKYSNAYYSQCL